MGEGSKHIWKKKKVSLIAPPPQFVKWMQAHLGTTVPEPSKMLQWQIGIRTISGFSGARMAVSFASLLSHSAYLYITNRMYSRSFFFFFLFRPS